MASGTTQMPYVKTTTYVNVASVAVGETKTITMETPVDASFTNPVLGKIHDPTKWYDCSIYLRGNYIYLENTDTTAHDYKGYVDIIWFH